MHGLKFLLHPLAKLNLMYLHSLIQAPYPRIYEVHPVVLRNSLSLVFLQLVKAIDTVNELTLTVEARPMTVPSKS
jgi:hypothetical protein